MRAFTQEETCIQRKSGSLQHGNEFKTVCLKYKGGRTLNFPQSFIDPRPANMKSFLVSCCLTLFVASNLGLELESLEYEIKTRWNGGEIDHPENPIKVHNFRILQQNHFGVVYNQIKYVFLDYPKQCW